MNLGLRVLDGVIETGILGLLVAAPLPFGAVDLWAQSAIEVVVVGLVVLTVARQVLGGTLLLRWSPLLGPALLITAVAAAQLVIGTSVNAHATLGSMRLLVAYWGFLVVVSLHLTTRGRVLRLLWTVVAAGTGLAVLGLANRAAGRALAPWFPPDFPVTRLIGTFVNPNHQALYFAITALLAAALLLRPRPAAEARSGPRVRRTLPSPGRLGRIALLVGAITVITAALLLTFSRGGVIGLVAGLAVALAASLRGRRAGVLLAAVGGVGAVALVVLQVAGNGALVNRFATLGREPFAEYRWAVWERTVRMLGEAPLTGVGLGAFQDAFPMYRPPGIESDKFIDHAHNDYLELGAEAGFPGLIAAGWAVSGLLGFVVRRLALRHDPLVRGIAAGGLGALAAVLVHSAFDFGLHMPANALMAVAVTALVSNVVALRTRVGSGGGVDLPVWTRPVTPAVRLAAAPVLAGALAAGVAVIVPPALADWHAQRAIRQAGEDARNRGRVGTADLAAALAELRRAAALDSRNAEIQGALADVGEQLAFRIWNFGVAPDGRRLMGLDERFADAQGYLATAYAAYERSLSLEPRAARLHDRFGRFLGALETVRVVLRGSSRIGTPIDPRLAPVLDSADSLLPRAMTELRTGIRWDPLNPYRHRNLGLFALALSSGTERTQVVAESFRAALAIEPRMLDEVVDALTGARASTELVRASMPRREEVWLRLALRLDREGAAPAAAAAFEEALAIAGDGPRQAEIRIAYARSLLRAGRASLALDQARRALVAAPRNHRAYAVLGDVYEALGLSQQAGEAFSSAVATADGDADQLNEQRGRLAAFYERRGLLEDALAVRRRMVQDAPADPFAHQDLARALERVGQPEQALDEYGRLLALAVNNGGLRLVAAEAFARLGRLEEAAAAYQGAMPPEPDRQQADVRIRLASVYHRLGRTEQAIEQYRQALRIDATRGDARSALEALVATTGR
jgi:O-antigen ligase/tetratricopeptide (TPR) repeat protein